MHLVLLQGLALWEEQRDDAVCVVVGTQDLRPASSDMKVI